MDGWPGRAVGASFTLGGPKAEDSHAKLVTRAPPTDLAPGREAQGLDASCPFPFCFHEASSGSAAPAPETTKPPC